MDKMQACLDKMQACLDNTQDRTLEEQAAAFDRFATLYQERRLLSEHADIDAQIKDLTAQLPVALAEVEQIEREAEQAEAYITRLEHEVLLHARFDDLHQELPRHDKSDEPNYKKRASFISIDHAPKAAKKAAKETFHKDTPCPVCRCDQSMGHYAAIFDRKPCVKCHSTQSMLSNKMMQWASAKGVVKPTVTWKDFKAMTMPDGILHMMNTGEGTPRQWASFGRGNTDMCEEVAQWLTEKQQSRM
jgi:hypothetical protein